MTESLERQRALRNAAIHHVREQAVTSRVRRIAIPLVLCGMLAGGGVTYAAATVLDLNLDLATDHPTAEEQAIVDQLEPLVQKLQVATGLEDTLVTTLDGEPNGYGSFILESDRPALTLYWKGDLPTRISRMIAEHPDIDVTVREAAFSNVELVTARDAIADQLNKELDGRGTLVKIGPDTRARGLVIDVYSEQGLTENDVRQAVARITPVPLVEMNVGEDAGVVLF